MTKPLICTIAGLLLAAAAQAAPDLVIVVRHAERETERAAEPAADPPLSAAGRQRAAQLAELLADGRITAIVTTSLRRTRETAAPLAQALGIAPQVVGFRKGEFAAHVPEVVAALDQMNGNVLVVGHGNTANEIVTALTGKVQPPLCETSFGQVFVVTPASRAVIKLRYGEADPAPGHDCQ